MRFEQPQTLKAIAELIDCEYVGRKDHVITGINEIHVVQQGDIVFVDHPKYYDKALASEATTILINKKVDCPPGKALIISEAPFDDFNKLILHFKEKLEWNKSNQPESVGSNSMIHPSVQIGNNVKIGNNVIIHPGVVLYDNVIIGDNVILHANVVLGGDAFYYKKKEGIYDKLISCGKVIIENDVEVGASSTIDKGVTGNTIIGKGTKIDNKVHIGHDSYIGENCLFAAHVGIAGCVTIEDDVILWGQVGVVSDLTIGKGAVVLGQSGVTKDLAPGKTYFGSPVGDARVKYREIAALRKLPDVIEQL